MKQSVVFPILLQLLLCSSSLARNKPQHPTVATPAPGPSSNSDCSTIIYSMMDCVNYLSVGSNDTKPVKTCCVGIQTVVQYNPHCICVGLEMSKEMGIPLNNTRALAMPSTCKIPIAPPHCGVSLPGASTPALSPVSPSPMSSSPSSAESPSTSPSLAESPAVRAPSPSSSSSNSSSATNNNLSLSTFTLLALSSIAYFSI